MVLVKQGLLEKQEREINMYICFHCGKRAVIWQNDYDFEDMGYDGDGIVHLLHCSYCGADIEYRVPINDLIEEEVDPEMYEDDLK